ncbi:MAG TPA: hypothetical protein VF861_14535 [Telluria sp.]
MLDRRQDRTTATTVIEALRMKTAFGDLAARRLLERQGVPPAVARRTLAGRHDPRQLPSCP